jgi:cytochrome c6
MFMKHLLVIVLAAGVVALLPARAADVKENWTKHCVKCHGEDGKGDTKMGKKAGVKDLTEAKTLEGKKDDQLFKSVKEGVKDGDKTLMKAYGEEGLSDDEIKALVAHVRTFKK